MVSVKKQTYFWKEVKKVDFRSAGWGRYIYMDLSDVIVLDIPKKLLNCHMKHPVWFICGIIHVFLPPLTFSVSSLSPRVPLCC